MVVTEQPLYTLVAVDQGVMVGVVTAQIMPTEKCGDADIISSPERYKHVSSSSSSGGGDGRSSHSTNHAHREVW